MGLYKESKSIEDYNYIYKMDACIRYLLDLNKAGCVEYLEETGAYVDLYCLFNKKNILDMFDEYMYHCICAIVDNKLLMIEIKHGEDEEKEICRLSTFPNVDSIFIEKPDEKSYKARIIDYMNNVYNDWDNWSVCASAEVQDIKEQKFPIIDVIKPIHYSDISKKIWATKNRQLLLDKIEKLNDEDVFKVLKYINENLENENDYSKKLR